MTAAITQTIISRQWCMLRKRRRILQSNNFDNRCRWRSTSMANICDSTHFFSMLKTWISRDNLQVAIWQHHQLLICCSQTNVGSDLHDKHNPVINTITLHADLHGILQSICNCLCTVLTDNGHKDYIMRLEHTLLESGTFPGATADINHSSAPNYA